MQRLLGKKVIFITGTDEHGEKIATAAAAGGSSPAEHCDLVSQAYNALWEDVRFFLSKLSLKLKYPIRMSLRYYLILVSLFFLFITECS